MSHSRRAQPAAPERQFAIAKRLNATSNATGRRASSEGERERERRGGGAEEEGGGGERERKGGGGEKHDRRRRGEAVRGGGRGDSYNGHKKRAAITVESPEAEGYDRQAACVGQGRAVCRHRP